MALVVIIVANVVVVAMGVTVTAVKSDTPANPAFPSATQTINLPPRRPGGPNQKPI